jgi:hypothetical protein
MKRSLYTLLHIITHVLRGVDTYTPLMRVTLMVIVMIVYMIMLLEFLLTITPYACSQLCSMC